jgi:hypothetical protein
MRLPRLRPVSELFTASCLLVRFAPGIFAPGAQACLDDDSTRDPLAERGEKTRERLRRTLRTRGDK